MDTLYFYRKRIESVVKIIQLWADFSKEAKMDFRNFLDKKFFFLHVAIVLAFFNPKNNEN